MPAHPLFDEAVVTCIPEVTDALIPHIPDNVAAVHLILRPGPTDAPTDVAVEIEIVGATPPDGWQIPETVANACRKLATAWTATGHAMPALRFNHTRDENGEWQANAEPMLEW